MTYATGAAGGAEASVALPVTIHVFERMAENAAWRGAGFLVDSILVAGVSATAAAVATFAIGRSGGAGGEDLIAVFLAAYLGIGLLVQLAYLTLAEGLTGTTLGKLGCFPSKLKVVRVDGGKVGFLQAFVRAGCGLFEANLAFGPAGALIATVVVSLRPDNRRVGDLLAGTMVVDATKLVDLTITEEGASLEMADRRVVEFARLEKASVAMWLGKPQTYSLKGLGPDGRPVSVRLRCLPGFTVFGEQEAMGLARKWLEWRFGIPFAEGMQWWRLALVAASFAFAALAVGSQLFLFRLAE